MALVDELNADDNLLAEMWGEVETTLSELESPNQSASHPTTPQTWYEVTR